MVRDFLADEINSHIDAYACFSSSSLSSFKEKIRCYFQLKSYNKDFCDMLPLVAANAFSIRIIIFSSPAQPINQCIIVNHLTSSLAALTILRISLCSYRTSISRAQYQSHLKHRQQRHKPCHHLARRHYVRQLRHLHQLQEQRHQLTRHRRYLRHLRWQRHELRH